MYVRLSLNAPATKRCISASMPLHVNVLPAAVFASESGKLIGDAAVEHHRQRDRLGDLVGPDGVGERLLVLLLAERDGSAPSRVAVLAAVRAGEAVAVATERLAERVEDGKDRVARLTARLVLAREAGHGARVTRAHKIHGCSDCHGDDRRQPTRGSHTEPPDSGTPHSDGRATRDNRAFSGILRVVFGVARRACVRAQAFRAEAPSPAMW